MSLRFMHFVEPDPDTERADPPGTEEDCSDEPAALEELARGAYPEYVHQRALIATEATESSVNFALRRLDRYDDLVAIRDHTAAPHALRAALEALAAPRCQSRVWRAGAETECGRPASHIYDYGLYICDTCIASGLRDGDTTTTETLIPVSSGAITAHAVVANQVAAEYAEVCICSAILLQDGTIIRGHRHHDCIRTAAARYRHTAGWSPRLISEKGFITSRNRFVGRKEALQLQQAAGIPSAQPRGYQLTQGLYSEDLY